MVEKRKPKSWKLIIYSDNIFLLYGILRYSEKKNSYHLMKQAV